MAKYRTAMGKNIDLDMLRTRNQNTRAVGNMNVDAAGNTLDSNNKIISDSTKRVNQLYSKTTVNPGAMPKRDGHMSPLQRQLAQRSQDSQTFHEAPPPPASTPPQPQQPQPQITSMTPAARTAPQPDEFPAPAPPANVDENILSSSELQNLQEWDEEEPVTPTITPPVANTPSIKSRRK